MMCLQRNEERSKGGAIGDLQVHTHTFICRQIMNCDVVFLCTVQTLQKLRREKSEINFLCAKI